MYQQYMPQQQYQYQNQQQNYMAQQPYMSQAMNLQMVDSVDVVKAKDVDLSGNPVYYPNVNGKEIYKKQLLPDGSSKISTYTMIEDSEISVDNKDYLDKEYLTNTIESLKTEIISEIKSLFNN